MNNHYYLHLIREQEESKKKDEEIKRLKGKIKMLEIMLESESNYSRRMVTRVLEIAEK
jgi:hypothetical protein